MSRTDKDRPYWVKMNDRSLGTVEHHEHCVPRWRQSRKRLTNRGEYMLVEGDEPVWILRHTNGTPGMTPEEHEAYRYPYGRYYRPSWVPRTAEDDKPVDLRLPRLRWYYEKPVHPEWVGRTWEEIPSPEGCDLGPWHNRQWRDYGYQCTVEPYKHNKPSHWYAPGKDFRRIENGKDRTRKRIGMRNFVKEYNTYGEVEDEWQDFPHRHAPVGGGWWD